MRVAKFIASSGVCSRRQAEKLIEQGVVSIDGKIITSPAVGISSDNIVTVNGKKLDHIPLPRLWLYYKPVGLITTHNDPQGRKTVFESLADKLPRVISVGRLDINSEGLLLLTNSGEVSRYFESPQNRIERIYKVRVFGKGRALDFDNQKIEIDGVKYHPKSIKQLQKTGANSWYEVVLTEGKNREIRRIFEYFGFEVSRLIRTNFGSYSLGNLKPGEFKEVKLDENYCRKTQE
ncbi:MAG: pseudouridine synthase [Rickettsiaceae bacterium]